jgi:hypothetical protein
VGTLVPLSIRVPPTIPFLLLVTDAAQCRYSGYGNGKDVERSCCRFFSRYYPDISLQELRRTMKIFRIVGIQARFESGTSNMSDVLPPGPPCAF